MNNLIKNINLIHTTEMGYQRIIKNVGIFDKNIQKNREFILNFCKQIIKNPKSNITIAGKNYYVSNNDVTLTINRHSFTIITAKKTGNFNKNI